MLSEERILRDIKFANIVTSRMIEDDIIRDFAEKGIKVSARLTIDVISVDVEKFTRKMQLFKDELKATPHQAIHFEESDINGKDDTMRQNHTTP